MFPVTQIMPIEDLNEITPLSDRLESANTFIRKLIQQHYADVADQCAALAAQAGPEPYTRRAFAKVLSRLQEMREVGDSYSRKVMSLKDPVAGQEALRACMEFWIEDLKSMIAIQDAEPSIKPHVALSAEQSEEMHIMKTRLLTIYGEMLAASLAWLTSEIEEHVV